MTDNKITVNALFNQEAALEALKSTAIKAGRGAGGSSELTTNIVMIFKSAAEAGITELGLNQVQAAYKAATGQDLKIKVFADRCWTISTKNKRAKNPLLKSGSTLGVYALI